MKRYALLDTDFISKTHSVQDDGGNHLIDRVIELPEYEFFCHAQIVTELNRYADGFYFPRPPISGYSGSVVKTKI